MLKRLSQWTIISILMIFATLSSARAEEQYNIKKMTPEVKSALEGRRDRYQQLNDFKSKGLIGENNKGYVQAFSDRSDVQSLVKEENRDRKIIYETIALQNDLKDALGIIESVFAKEQRQRALPGQKIQNEDGTWITK